MRIHWLSPGDPAQRTGGYLYNAHMVTGLRALGHTVAVRVLDGDWPRPAYVNQLAALLGALPPGEPVVADGLCWPGLGESARQLLQRNPVWVVVHSLLSRETGVRFPDAVDQWERASWQGVRGLVATSAQTADEIGEATVLIPGTASAERVPVGTGQRWLCVASLTRRKGHDVLLNAFRSVPGTLRLVGGPRDPAWAQHLRGLVRTQGLANRVVFVGECSADKLERELRAADVLVQPAHYEAFGMAIAEGVARGLPVITGPAGVLAHLPDGAVRVVRDGDWVGAMRALAPGPVRQVQAERAWEAASSLPDWTTQARRFAELLEAR